MYAWFDINVIQAAAELCTPHVKLTVSHALNVPMFTNLITLGLKDHVA